MNRNQEKVFITNVKCDACEWRLLKVNVFAWHNVLCPRCGKSIICTDEDIEMAEKIQALVEAGLFKNATADGGKETKGKPPLLSFSVRVDTSALRKKEKE